MTGANESPARNMVDRDFFVILASYLRPIRPAVQAVLDHRGRLLHCGSQGESYHELAVIQQCRHEIGKTVAVAGIVCRLGLAALRGKRSLPRGKDINLFAGHNDGPECML
jgi:hypothetical protein